MNYVKCLQHASGDLYKLVTDILIEVESCAAKSDLVETIRCALSDAGLKKMNSLVLRLMEVTKCALE
ncbi:hypothetical protein ONE63_004662 [Megalurothrips usitatus]|uniref:Uncharacterized protein n=1 Tax=Megalurothrips usitatus TaxID=439358 RepID=A0AAV7X6U3_9NEOP|nr:hypothetical protein ONE63_004662 [Megalurothrips usitatus]